MFLGFPAPCFTILTCCFLVCFHSTWTSVKVVGAGANSPRLPGPEPHPLSLNLSRSSPAPPHPDSLLGSVAATGHHSAGSPHATEAAQVGGARYRHCGDSEVLGRTRESRQGHGGGGEGLPLNTGCPQPFPPQRRSPQALLTPIRSPLLPTQGWSRSHPERVCHDLCSSVISPLGEAYEKLPA